MTTRTSTQPSTRAAYPTTMFTAGQWRALRALRERYRQQRDLISEREMARLRFLRWLYRHGRLAP